MSRVRAFAPASIGNFAAGFDVLGAAIVQLDPGGPDGDILGDWVEVAEAAEDALVCAGPYAHRLPARPEDNLVLKARAAFARAWGRPLPPLAIRLEKHLPVGSGLGSSTTSVVATLAALDALFHADLGLAALLRAGGEVEGQGAGAVHLDNVAPALLGGLRLVTAEGLPAALPFPDGLVFVVASPDLELATRKARGVLPAQVPLPLAVAHAQNLAALVLALATGDAARRRASLRDLLAEPYRAALVPGFRAVQAAALEAGAEGCTFSGAGPAIFAVSALDRAPAVARDMNSAWALVGVPSRVRICRLEPRGARVV